MKYLSLLVSIMVTIYAMPAVAADQNETNGTSFSLMVAKSGCCKTRKSPQHPWAKIHNNFDQCEAANNADGDNIYQSTGLYWWDRSC